MKSSEVINHIINWIINYKEKNNIKGLVVGVSGGIDSALTSTLCAMSGINTICLNMPIFQKDEQYKRSENHINWLIKKFKNVHAEKIELTNTFSCFSETVHTNNDKSNLGLANTRSRLRMLTLYYYATINDSIVVGTGNKVEDFGIGFYTKYGDGGVDISPIADLMKSEVFKLSLELGINKEILNAKPTDGLWDDDRSDEDQIGANYYDIEKVMKKIDNGENPKNFDKELKKVYDIYIRHHNANKHKMVEIPICFIPDNLKL
jgi:NAD+ synthase